jgi:heptosyltransferase-2
MFYIIYQTAFIGDIILSTSMVRTIKRTDPDGNVIFITTPHGKSVLQHNKLIDEIVVYDKKSADSGVSGVIKAAGNIKNITGTGDSIYISPHRFIRASIIGLLTGSKLRIGFENSALAFLYNRTVPYESGIHELERNLKLLMKAFPGRLDDEKPGMPELYPSEDNFNKVRQLINNRFHSNESVIAIAPGSVWKTKKWPEEYFKKLIQLLNNKGIKIILIGGTDDMELCSRLSSENALNLAGGLSLLESAAAVSLSKAAVSNDSAPLHMASAMNVPTIALFGSTTPDFGFGPLADKSVILEKNDIECRPCGRHGRKKCAKKHFNCMNKIYPETVYKEVIKIVRV